MSKTLLTAHHISKILFHLYQNMDAKHDCCQFLA